MEPDESGLWKYLELPQFFQQKAGEIDVLCKQHLRVCERLAAHVAKQKPKTPQEFERVEYLKDFVVKSAELNDRTSEILGYVKERIQDVCSDVTAIKEGAQLKAIIRDQGEKIEKLIKERDEFMHKYYGLRKTERRADQANP